MSKQIKRYLNYLSNALKQNKKIIFCALISTFAWGTIAHGSFFLHNSFSHDSLNELVPSVMGNSWKIQLGRVFVPIYRLILGEIVTTPWTIGLLSLFYIAIAVFLVAKIFKIKSRSIIVLISGIFVTNISVISITATYIHDLDCYMFALALSVFAVYLWRKYKKGYLCGAIPICFSLGLYQSFISVTITLIIISLIICLINEKEANKVIRNGIKGCVMLVGGGILYYVAIKVICFISGTPLLSGGYNSLDVASSTPILIFIKNIFAGWNNTFKQFFSQISIYPEFLFSVLNAIILVIIAICTIKALFSKELKIKAKILLVVLVALLPISMNVVYALTNGMSHDLMHYAIWLTNLLALLMIVKSPTNSLKSALRSSLLMAVSGALLVILWSNTQVANIVYLKKDLEQKANLSLFTRIVQQIEDYPGYISGETPVVFVGKPDSELKEIPGLEKFYKITGSDNKYVLGAAEQTYYRAYFSYILHNPANIADSVTWDKIQNDERVIDMSCYPKKESMSMIDNIMVIKLGEH